MKKKSKLVQNAQKYIQKGNIDRAIQAYLKIVEQDPKEVRIWLKIGDLYARKGDKEKASTTYLRVAEAYEQQGFYPKAVAIYKQILKFDPEMIEVSIKLAQLYHKLGLMSDAISEYNLIAKNYERMGKLQESLDIYKRIVDVDPDNINNRINLADLYSRWGQNDQAISELDNAARYLHERNRADEYLRVAERLLYYQPNNVNVLKKVAKTLILRKEYKEALAKLHIGFKSAPKDVEVLELLSDTFIELKQRVKAVATLNALARIYEEMGDEESLKETRKRIEEITPQSQSTLQRLGVRRQETPANLIADAEQLAKSGHFNEAYDQIMEVLEKDPQNLKALEFLAQLYVASKDYNLAADALLHIAQSIMPSDVLKAGGYVQRAMELTPGNPKAEALMSQLQNVSARRKAAVSYNLDEDITRAKFFLQQGLLDEARALLSQISTRFHGDPRIGSLLNELRKIEALPLADEQRNEQTATFSQASSEEVIWMDDSENHFDLGISYREMGQYDDAIREFSRACSDPGKRFACLRMIGLCHVAKGDVSEGIGFLRKGLETSNIPVHEALNFMYELGQIYEKQKNREKALYYYLQIVKHIDEYRDVRKRIQELGQNNPSASQQGSTETAGTDSNFIDDADSKPGRRFNF